MFSRSLPDAPAPAHLRFTFERGSELERHVRVVGSEQLLFFPHPLLSLESGARVLLQLASRTQQQATVPAFVHSFASHPYPGAWLELLSAAPVHQLARALDNGLRRYRRFATAQDVRVQREGQAAVAGRLADVGAGGARFRALPGAFPVGSQIELSVPGSKFPFTSRVVWCRRGEIAVEFVKGRPGERNCIAEFLGRVAAQWAIAPHVHHRGLCSCGHDGAVIEPELPSAVLQRAAARPAPAIPGLGLPQSTAA